MKEKNELSYRDLKMVCNQNMFKFETTEELKSNKSLRAYQSKLSKYDLVILDEFGYISADKEGAELLFTHISLRAGQKSTIITTNLSFDRWGEIFGDPVMTAAMTDR